MIDTIQDKKEISRKLKERAIFEGFSVAGIASIPGSSRVKLRTNALERWLSNNYHADMKWMETEKRKNINSLFEDAKSVLCVGFTYINSQNNNDNFLKVAKFSQGEDYHKVIHKKLKNIGKWINLEIPDCKWKICVDTSPLLEKAWAEEAGIGWIGKNSNLISKKNGSWFTLGFMILTKDLTPDKPHQSLCGKCDICIEHCPTKAIVEPFVIQSDLCIAYHTIESREKNIPKKIEKKLKEIKKTRLKKMLQQLTVKSQIKKLKQKRKNLKRNNLKQRLKRKNQRRKSLKRNNLKQRLKRKSQRRKRKSLN